MRIYNCVTLAVALLVMVLPGVHPSMESTLFEMDLYQMLGLDRNCTNRDIRSKYRQLARKYHPDKLSDNSNSSSNQFIVLVEAVEILSDEQTRQRYDRRLQRASSPRGRRRDHRHHRPNRHRRHRHHHHPPHHWEDATVHQYHPQQPPHHRARPFQRPDVWNEPPKTKEQKREERLRRKNWRAERRARNRRSKIREAARKRAKGVM